MRYKVVGGQYGHVELDTEFDYLALHADELEMLVALPVPYTVDDLQLAALSERIGKQLRKADRPGS